MISPSANGSSSGSALGSDQFAPPRPPAQQQQGVPGAPQMQAAPKAPAGQPGSLPTSSGLPTPGTTSPMNIPSLGASASIGGSTASMGAPPSGPLYTPPTTATSPTTVTPQIASMSGGGNYVPPPTTPQQQAAPQDGPSGVPAQQAAGTAPPTPGVSTSSMGPGNDLLSSQINLTPNAQTAQTMNNAQGLANNLSNPDVYQQVAQQAFNTFAQQSDPAYQASLRQAQAAAAASGGMGSGSLATEYGNLANERNLQLEGMQQNAEQNAVQQQAQYQLQQLQAQEGLGGQEFGQQQAETGQANQQQGFQQNEQEQAIQNAAQQAALQAQLQGQQFNENMGLANFAYGGNPAAAEAEMGQFYGGQGEQALQGAGTLASQNALNNALNGQYGGGVPNVGGGGYTIPQLAGPGGQADIPLSTIGSTLPYSSGNVNAGIDPNTGAPLPQISGLPTAPGVPMMDPTSGYPMGDYEIDPSTGQPMSMMTSF